MYPADDQPLRIAFLAYRGKPHVGGQGVYTRHLTKALVDLGHHVEVLGGQPFPVLDDRVPLIELPSLDIYNDYFPMRMPGIWELKHWPDFVEVTSFSMGTFPEPMAFSWRAWDHLRRRKADFDLVHDNQSLGYGLLADPARLPGARHDPPPDHRRPPARARRTPRTRVQAHHAAPLVRLHARCRRGWRGGSSASSPCPSRASHDIVKDHGVDAGRMHVVPVGVDPDTVPADPRRRAHPGPARHHRVGRRHDEGPAVPARSGRQAAHRARHQPRRHRHAARKAGGRPRPSRASGSTDVVSFVTGVHDERIFELYSEAELAVVPSLYEGFSLPAIEAMSCGVPLVATTGGALPEVVGADGDTALLVAPGDSEALAAKIRMALDDPELRAARRRATAASGSSTTGAGGTRPSARSSSTAPCSGDAPRPLPADDAPPAIAAGASRC